MIINLMLLAVLGFAVSAYAYFLEKKVKTGEYKPACDISDAISCSKPILSEYGSLIGVSNSIIGMIFYVAVFVCALLGLGAIAFYLSVAGAIGSVFLAYILYFKIRTLCLVCTATYVINALLLYFSYIQCK